MPKVDPLDVITGFVAATLGVAAYATMKGHAIPALSTLAALYGAAYIRDGAPSEIPHGERGGSSFRSQ